MHKNFQEVNDLQEEIEKQKERIEILKITNRQMKDDMLFHRKKADEYKQTLQKIAEMEQGSYFYKDKFLYMKELANETLNKTNHKVVAEANITNRKYL